MPIFFMLSVLWVGPFFTMHLALCEAATATAKKPKLVLIRGGKV